MNSKPEDSGFSEAIGFLAKEKSLAENYVRIMKEFGKEDLQNYAEAIGMYANAKAEYDGLIEQMKYELEASKTLEPSSEFQKKLNNAADRRVAFTSFVSEKVIHPDPTRKDVFGIGEAIKAVPELISALTKAAISIWHEYHGVKDARRKAIIDQLEALKWKPFQDAGTQD